MKSASTDPLLLEIFHRSGWLSERKAGFRDALLTSGYSQSYQTGQFTNHLGDELGGIFGVIQGSFGVIGQSPSVGVVLGHIYRSAGWFGEGPLITRRPRMLSFKAMEPSLVHYIPLNELDHLLRHFPGAETELMSLVAYSSQIAVDAMADLLIRRADRRIAAVLLRVTDAQSAVPTGSGQSGPSGCFVTQSDLAEMANVSRHTINAVLKKFEAEGWIKTGYGRISVCSAADLRNFLVDDG
ncbi:Crp/Fnr family transcriptional regulator [Paracoccus cavernae]|uniref:Crp/Fnr family transcriptional regulator n=1 Tax=Paracoccus cavernae TaxID=1571207 RepID=A0ABT8D594_9RHOB|nr:Crp/Fnr family transcriptional regulator [Paracoccus cavernae]